MKPCPNCGKRVARISGMNIGMAGYRQVWCDTEKGGCSAAGGRADYKVKGGLSVARAEEKAIALWNHRPEEDRLRSALQAAELERSEAQGRTAFLDRACALVAAERDSAIGRAEAVEQIAAWLARLDVSEWVDRGLHNEELLEEAARCIRDGSWKGGM